MAATDGTSDESLCNRCLNWKAHDQFYRNKRSKTGRCTACKLCMDIARAHWIAANPEKLREVERNARVRTRETRNKQILEWAKRNRAHVNENRKAWRETRRDLENAAAKKWQSANPEKVLANLVRRKARKLQATPAWANDFFITEAYRLAKLREKVCGGKWHVDHIVPLRSKLVCGLHVEHNLQVIPASVNQRKSNTHWPDMP